ncbi:nuclear transport factor 2 family protein [Actinomadura kijaniata]|uniref:nuclear transport factor 2 family protein n=1 Tax=Actinomadura kijaniata TaxID=46161 RepID=UPI000B2525D2|nr:nuclear transport factor 2 family protein [Actinomadura kijaniata]
MALTRQTMTDEQRKSVALEYLKAFDRGGVTSDGGGILDLLADDAQVYFPKWGLATGKDEIARMFADVGDLVRVIRHDYATFNWVISGDMVVCEGTSRGEHRDGPWRAGDPEWGAGRFCDVFEIRDWLIHRCFIYLDPDYAGRDRERYPWLADRAAASVEERNVATVRTFLRLLEEGDIEAWMELWAEDADHHYPYGTEMFPRHLHGKEAIYDNWKAVPDRFAKRGFPLRDIWTDRRTGTVIARFDGDNVLKGGDGTYDNAYICVFSFDEAGRIREYWEYFDPIVAGTTFGLAEIRYLQKEPHEHA